MTCLVLSTDVCVLSPFHLFPLLLLCSCVLCSPEATDSVCKGANELETRGGHEDTAGQHLQHHFTYLCVCLAFRGHNALPLWAFLFHDELIPFTVAACMASYTCMYVCMYSGQWPLSVVCVCACARAMCVCVCVCVCVPAYRSQLL